MHRYTLAVHSMEDAMRLLRSIDLLGMDMWNMEQHTVGDPGQPMVEVTIHHEFLRPEKLHELVMALPMGIYLLDYIQILKR